MKFTKSLISMCFLIMLFSAVSFTQDKDMMKDDMKKNDMMKDNMTHDDMMMKVDKNMDGVALKGYDPVSYFTDMKPEMGMADISYKWGGATWQFTSNDHLKMFKENPSKYAPQFGGYCAYAVSKNMTAQGDPTVWQVKDGKLYLNVNKDVKKLFNEDLDDNIMKAEKNWKTLGMTDDKMDDDKMMDDKIDKN